MKNNMSCRVQRKLVLQPAIWASCSWHKLAHKSFQLAPKPFLISRIDYNPSVIWISQKNGTCPSGKLRTKITSPIAKSTGSGLLDMTFFAHWEKFKTLRQRNLYINPHFLNAWTNHTSVLRHLALVMTDVSLNPWLNFTLWSIYEHFKCSLCCLKLALSNQNK